MRIATSFLLLLVSMPLLAAEGEPVPVVEEPGIESARVQSSGKDAPSRVARLSLTQGEVSLAPAGTDEWADAVLNRPLTSGDRVWVDRDARAEFQVGSATVHLDQNSGFSFEELDDDVIRMSLTDGTATVRVRRKAEGETLVVETPNASVALLHPGEYHIEVNQAGDATVVKVRSGEAAVTGEKDSYIVRAAESATFKGTKELTADIGAIGTRSSFESWANDRDRREERSASSRYVSRDVVGYEDLDDDGDWISEPSYGYVWTPRHVYAGWAPYRDGRWAWVSPWGWTWVDNARWGFAPFHYGRWVTVRDRWCWVPGPRHIRPVYAPALVGWTGSPGLSVSVGIGSGVGWYPLGPREIYVPGYWHSRRYIHNVNYTNTIIVNDRYITDAYRGRRDRLDYRYRNQLNAVTIVPRSAFVGGRPIGGRLTTISQRDLRAWRQDSRPPAIAPDHGSVFAGNRSTPFNDRNARFARSDREESRNRGSSFSGRVPFDTEKRAIEANGNRPVARSQLFTSDSRDRGDFRGARPATQGSAAGGNRFDTQRDTQRTERQTQPRSSFGPSTDFVRRESFTRRQNDNNNDAARGSAPVVAPSLAPTLRQESARRESLRSNPVERTPRFETSPRPTFESTPRAREDRSSQRVERQREARQSQPRVQSAPAQETFRASPQPQQQQAAPRAWRGDGNGNRGGNSDGGKSSGNNRSTNRQSQK